MQDKDHLICQPKMRNTRQLLISMGYYQEITVKYGVVLMHDKCNL